MLNEILPEDRATNSVPGLGAAVECAPATSTVDRSAIFQRLRRIWPLGEKLISIERSRLRAEGMNRRDAGNEAWRLADAAFDDDAIQLAAELRKLVGSTPQGLSLEQAFAWRLSLMVVSACTQRSTRLIPAATALIVQSQLRVAMDCVGDYSFESQHEAEARESVIKFSVSKESCLTEVDRITEIVSSIEDTGQNDEFADELNDLLEALCIAREVIDEHWETTGLSLPPG